MVLSASSPGLRRTRLPDEFRMAIEELIHNAIEHADADEPEVHAHISDSGADEGIAITVADDGPEIPEHETGVLTSDEETPLEHSEGIGLWMVTWIVNAADGDITFERSDLGGSRIPLEFPETEPPALTLRM